MTGGDQQAVPEIRLHLETTWESTLDSFPMPELTYNGDGNSYLDPNCTVTFDPTDEQMRAAGYIKRQRWVSDWEDA